MIVLNYKKMISADNLFPCHSVCEDTHTNSCGTYKKQAPMRNTDTYSFDTYKFLEDTHKQYPAKKIQPFSKHTHKFT